MALLLAGGFLDPNLTVLADAALRTNVEVLDLRLPADESQAFCWSPEQCAPRISDKPLQASCAFIRHDVFGAMQDPRPEVSTRASAWYQTLMGWLLSEPRIRLFNRNMTSAAMNKPASLVLAREAGLRIPETWITNEVSRFAANGGQSIQRGSERGDDNRLEKFIAKPVLGGDYCYSLSEALDKTDLRSGLAAAPAIVQKRLIAPEIRIYVIGHSAFAFEVRSVSLDYRVNQDAELVLLQSIPPELAMLRKLMSRLGMDFGAADFKTDSETGQLVFLELNTSPMFARFDQISEGQISAAIIHELTNTN
jgi:hypothetical protein